MVVIAVRWRARGGRSGGRAGGRRAGRGFLGSGWTRTAGCSLKSRWVRLGHEASAWLRIAWGPQWSPSDRLRPPATGGLVGGLDLVLTPDQASLIRGRIFNRAKKAQGGTGANQYTEQKRQSDALPPSQKTSSRLATDLGVSPRTVERDGAFASAVDKLRDVAPDLEADIARGEAPPRKTRKTSSK